MRRREGWMGARREGVFPPSLRRLARQDLQRFRSGHSPPWSRPSSAGPRRHRLAPPALLPLRGASSFKSPQPCLNPQNFRDLGARPVRWHDNFDDPRLENPWRCRQLPFIQRNFGCCGCRRLDDSWGSSGAPPCLTRGDLRLEPTTNTSRHRVYFEGREIDSCFHFLGSTPRPQRINPAR